MYEALATSVRGLKLLVYAAFLFWQVWAGESVFLQEFVIFFSGRSGLENLFSFKNFSGATRVCGLKLLVYEALSQGWRICSPSRVCDSGRNKMCFPLFFLGRSLSWRMCSL